MKPRFNFLLAVVVAVVMLFVVGCGGDSAVDSTDDAGEETLSNDEMTISVFLPALQFTYFSAMVELIEDTAEELGITILIVDCENSQEKQVRDIEDAISAGVDGLVVIPITAEGTNLAIQAAIDAGIPLVTVDRTSMIDDVVAHVGGDFVEQGKMAAKLFIEGLEAKYPDAERWDVVEIQGTPGASATTDRGGGMNEILAQEPRINIVAALTGEFTTTDGRRVAEDQLTANPGLHGILAHNDMMGHGVIEAAKEFGILEQLVIVSVDAQISMVEEVLAGSSYATVTHPTSVIVTGINALYDHINGKEVEKFILVGGEEVRQNNAQEILDSGKAF